MADVEVGQGPCVMLSEAKHLLVVDVGSDEWRVRSEEWRVRSWKCRIMN
jgi:hypothetical protein